MDPDLRESLHRMVEEVVARNPGADVDELNRLLAERAESYNATPQPELAGLSPAQMYRLLHGDWSGPDAALLVRLDLSLAELGASPMLVNSRLVLDAMRGSQGVKATANGNLNRAFVSAMVQQMRLERDERWAIERKGKALNEADTRELEVLRHVLGMAGLVRKTQGRFHITKRGEKLVSPERAGELFALLFETVFRKLNLGVFWHVHPEFHAVQHTVAFTFYALSRLGDQWYDIPEIAADLLLPAVREHVPPLRWSDPVEGLVHYQVLKPLAWLGLVERREAVWQAGAEREPPGVRKTPLFARALAFRL